MTDKIGVMNWADHPEAAAAIQDIVHRFRLALAPLFNADLENLEMNQSYTISAAGILAGMTAGHMIAFGAAQPRDRARIIKVITIAARAGMKMGEQEAATAIGAQHASNGGTFQ